MKQRIERERERESERHERAAKTKRTEKSNMESKKNKQHSTHHGTTALYQTNWNKIQQTFASLFNDLFSLLLQAKKQRTIR